VAQSAERPVQAIEQKRADTEWKFSKRYWFGKETGFSNRQKISAKGGSREGLRRMSTILKLGSSREVKENVRVHQKKGGKRKKMQLQKWKQEGRSRQVTSVLINKRGEQGGVE